jgi:hypothetical protein
MGKANQQIAVRTLERVFAKDSPIYISTITELELFSFPKLSKKEVQQIEALLGILAIINLDSKIARLAGYLRRNFSLKLPDSLITATALFTGSTSITRNIPDFKKIPHLSLLEV